MTSLAIRRLYVILYLMLLYILHLGTFFAGGAQYLFFIIDCLIQFSLKIKHSCFFPNSDLKYIEIISYDLQKSYLNSP